MNNSVLCIIPARSGSKGLKNKNLRTIEGKSLLQITVEEASRSNVFQTIHVSTESPEIKSEAERLGIEFPFMRKKSLSKDNVHVSMVVSDVILNFKAIGINFDSVCLLMPTSPLRTYLNIQNAAKTFQDSGTDSLVSVSPLGKLETNFRILNKNGLIDYYNSSMRRNQNRQLAKELYAVNGSIYFSKVSSFLESGTFHIDKVIGYEMSFINSIDVNTAEDLELARILFKYSRSQN